MVHLSKCSRGFRRDIGILTRGVSNDISQTERFLDYQKFQRLVDMVVSKPQTQETLTVEILEEIKK